MKKLQCESCQRIWFVDDADLYDQKLCPFCQATLQGKFSFSEYDTLDKLIFKAISEKGIEILRHPGQLTGFMLDTAPALRKEIRIFSRSITESYVKYMVSAFEQESEAAKTTLTKLHCLLTEEDGLSKEWADMLCERINLASSHMHKAGSSSLINVQIDDYSEVSETQISASPKEKAELYHELQTGIHNTETLLIHTKEEISEVVALLQEIESVVNRIFATKQSAITAFNTHINTHRDLKSLFRPVSYYDRFDFIAYPYQTIVDHFRPILEEQHQKLEHFDNLISAYSTVNNTVKESSINDEYEKANETAQKASEFLNSKKDTITQLFLETNNNSIVFQEKLNDLLKLAPTNNDIWQTILDNAEYLWDLLKEAKEKTFEESMKYMDRNNAMKKHYLKSKNAYEQTVEIDQELQKNKKDWQKYGLWEQIMSLIGKMAVNVLKKKTADTYIFKVPPHLKPIEIGDIKLAVNLENIVDPTHESTEEISDYTLSDLSSKKRELDSIRLQLQSIRNEIEPLKSYFQSVLNQENHQKLLTFLQQIQDQP
jgi:hypothetical protein